MKAFETELFDAEFRQGRSRLPVRDRVLGIVLHGKGDSLLAYQTLHEELRLPNIDFLLLNAPMKYSEGFKWMHDEPRHEKTLAATRHLLFELTSELCQFGYRAENVFWLGHSQGGRVIADFLFHSSDRFMGFIGVSTYVGFFDGWTRRVSPSARQTPWLLTHGSFDEVITLREIRADVRELGRGRVPLTYREFKKGHDFDHEVEMPFIRDWILSRATGVTRVTGAAAAPRAAGAPQAKAPAGVTRAAGAAQAKAPAGVTRAAGAEVPDLLEDKVVRREISSSDGTPL